MFNLKDLRTSLAECHVDNSSIIFKTLKEVDDPSYFLHRTRECLNEIQLGVNIPGNLILAIQLLNIVKTMNDQQRQKQKEEFEQVLNEAQNGPPLNS